MLIRISGLGFGTGVSGIVRSGLMWWLLVVVVVIGGGVVVVGGGGGERGVDDDDDDDVLAFGCALHVNSTSWFRAW